MRDAAEAGRAVTTEEQNRRFRRLRRLREENDVEERDPQTYAIIGAAMEVHRELGPGFLEAVYHDAMVIELGERSVPFSREMILPIDYKGRRLASTYRADFVCYVEIVVELKAASAMTPIDEAQLLNYLKATGFARGLLLNFGRKSLEFKRMVRSSGGRLTPTLSHGEHGST